MYPVFCTSGLPSSLTVRIPPSRVLGKVILQEPAVPCGPVTLKLMDFAATFSWYWVIRDVLEVNSEFCP